MMNPFFIVSLISTTFIWPFQALSEEWPQWRGPNQNGTTSERIEVVGGMADRLLWSAELGKSGSPVAVAQGKVFSHGFRWFV